MTAFFAFQQHS